MIFSEYMRVDKKKGKTFLREVIKLGLKVKAKKKIFYFGKGIGKFSAFSIFNFFDIISPLHNNAWQ